MLHDVHTLTRPNLKGLVHWVLTIAFTPLATTQENCRELRKFRHRPFQSIPLLPRDVCFLLWSQSMGFMCLRRRLNRSTRCVFGCVWFLSLNALTVRFMHVVACVHSRSFLLLGNRTWYKCTTVCFFCIFLLMDVWDYVQYLAVINKVSIHILCVWKHTFRFSLVNTREWNYWFRGKHEFSFLRNCQRVHQSSCTFCIRTSNVSVF